MIHTHSVGDRVQAASALLDPFTGTVIEKSRNGQVITVDIDNGVGVHCFDVDDLEGETP